jgi:hypothetical protein
MRTLHTMSGCLLVPLLVLVLVLVVLWVGIGAGPVTKLTGRIGLRCGIPPIIHGLFSKRIVSVEVGLQANDLPFTITRRAKRNQTISECPSILVLDPTHQSVVLAYGFDAMHGLQVQSIGIR